MADGIPADLYLLDRSSATIRGVVKRNVDAFAVLFCRRGGVMAKTILGIGLDAVSYGMVLFIISIGLSIMMGLMRVVNFAHGAFAMIGGYLASYALRSIGLSYPLAIIIAVLGTIAIASAV